MAARDAWTRTRSRISSPPDPRLRPARRWPPHGARPTAAGEMSRSRGFHRRRSREHGLHALASQLLDDQDLVGIAAAQTIRGMDQDGVDASFRGEDSDPLEPRAFENGAAIAVILDDHVGRDTVTVTLGVGDQGLGLAGDRVAISLLLARDRRAGRRSSRPPRRARSPSRGAVGPSPQPDGGEGRVLQTGRGSQATASGSPTGTSNCSSSVDPARAEIELCPPVTTSVTASK